MNLVNKDAGCRSVMAAAIEPATEQAPETVEIEPEEPEPIVVAPSPELPSAADIEQHRVTHIPFRSWCRHCCMGRGTGEQRGRHQGRTHDIPIIGVDYWYMTSRGLDLRNEMPEFPETASGEAALRTARQDGRIVKCLVVRCSATKCVFGHVVPVKGDDEDKFAANLVSRDVAWLGHVKLLLKTDNEVSLQAFATAALQLLKCQVQELDTAALEHPQAYDSQSNGVTEVGVRILRGLHRTQKLCLEARVGREIPVQHPLTTWLLEHVALLYNACVRVEDGRTAWGRARGRPFGQRLIGFGEQVLWKLPSKGPQHDVQGNMGPRLRPGTFLGYSRDSNSYRIALPDGTVAES